MLSPSFDSSYSYMIWAWGLFSTSLSWQADVRTHRGVVGGDINQDLRGAPATHVSVAVPHTANQVGLPPGGENREQTMTLNNTASTFHSFHNFIADAACYNLIISSRLGIHSLWESSQVRTHGWMEMLPFCFWLWHLFKRNLSVISCFSTALPTLMLRFVSLGKRTGGSFCFLF